VSRSRTLHRPPAPYFLERIEEIRDNADDRANDNVPAQQRQGNPYAPANDNVPPPVKPPDDERNR
jgi:hypothetical protein